VRNARWRDPGATDPIATTIVESDLGLILVAGTEAGVCALSLGDDAAALEAWLAQVCPHARRVDRTDWVADAAAIARAWVESPCDAPGPPPLDVRGAPFMRRVWSALQAIPCGETRTYSDVAAAIGAPNAARAAASGCANNLISLFIPCLRVVRRGGGLGGYAWGLGRKEALLARESGGLPAPRPIQMSMALERH